MRYFDEMQILDENEHYLVMYKAAGLAVQAKGVGKADLEHHLKNYLAAKRNDGTIPYISVVHRLDQPVEGLIVFAKSKEAAAVLSKQAHDHVMEKTYYAVTVKAPEKEEDTLENYMIKDSMGNRSTIVAMGADSAKKAILSYEVKKVAENGQALLKIHLVTGRHHQIRAQLAQIGCPIVGDRKYQPDDALNTDSLALCAVGLTFEDPITHEVKNYRIRPLGKHFQQFLK